MQDPFADPVVDSWQRPHKSLNSPCPSSSYCKQLNPGGAGEEGQSGKGISSVDSTKFDVHDRFSQPRKETEPNQLSQSKRKRIRRKQGKTQISKLKFVGNNAAGLSNKLESLENMLKENTSAFFIQETHLKRAGQIKTPSSNKYTWY